MARRLSRYRMYSFAARLLLKARLARLALPIFDRAVALEPWLGPVHARRAGALSRLGLWEEAALGFQAAVVLDPEAMHAWTGLVTALANLNRWDEAAVVCRRASALGSRHHVYRPPEPKAAA